LFSIKLPIDLISLIAQEITNITNAIQHRI
jgi:hypothetical protein